MDIGDPHEFFEYMISEFEDLISPTFNSLVSNINDEIDRTQRYCDTIDENLRTMGGIQSTFSNGENENSSPDSIEIMSATVNEGTIIEIVDLSQYENSPVNSEQQRRRRTRRRPTAYVDLCSPPSTSGQSELSHLQHVTSPEFPETIDLSPLMANSTRRRWDRLPGFTSREFPETTSSSSHWTNSTRRRWHGLPGVTSPEFPETIGSSSHTSNPTRRRWHRLQGVTSPEFPETTRRRWHRLPNVTSREFPEATSSSSHWTNSTRRRWHGLPGVTSPEFPETIGSSSHTSNPTRRRCHRLPGVTFPEFPETTNSPLMANSTRRRCHRLPGDSVSEVTGSTLSKSPRRINNDFTTHNASGMGESNSCIKCPICLENSCNHIPTSTKCGHVFCEECIRHALRRKSKCPLCNVKLTNRQLFRLYL